MSGLNFDFLVVVVIFGFAEVARRLGAVCDRLDTVNENLENLKDGLKNLEELDTIKDDLRELNIGVLTWIEVYGEELGRE